MLYQIKKVEVKSNDWKVVSGVGSDGAFLVDASVNRTNKKGEVFPNFDSIAEGAQIEGEPWQNDKGKQYLFAPRVKSGTGRAGFNIAAAQENKAKHIAEAQDNKEYSIKVSSTARDATLIAVAMLEAKAIEPTQFKAQWAIIRSWLWENWDMEKPKDTQY